MLLCISVRGDFGLLEGLFLKLGVPSGFGTVLGGVTFQHFPRIQTTDSMSLSLITAVRLGRCDFTPPDATQPPCLFPKTDFDIYECYRMLLSQCCNTLEGSLNWSVPDMIQQDVFPPHGETTEAKTKMHELPRLTLGVLTWIRICHQPSWWWRWQQTTGIHLNAWGLGLRGSLKPVGNPNLTKMQDMQGKNDKNVEREWHFGLGLNVLVGLCKASFCNPLYLFINFVSFVS